MRLFKNIGPLQHYLQKFRDKKYSIGLVPTMGALHAGHISLVQQSKEESDITACSIFVNPVQFNDPKDFERYPVTIEKDILLLEANKTDILFLPSVGEIYPAGLSAIRHYGLGYLENILEGYYRPGHFQGVCNAVHRLLDIIEPHQIFLGQKDYQQCLVLKKMMQVFFPSIELNIINTVREADGLAMSSRNMRLSTEARAKAVAIYETLEFIKQNILDTPVQDLKHQAVKNILANGFDKVDYVEICDAETLLSVPDYTNNKKIIALAAAFIDGTRSIDNMVIE